MSVETWARSLNLETKVYHLQRAGCSARLILAAKGDEDEAEPERTED